jgi:hypothetical protein
MLITQNPLPELLFELGRLQVFCYPTDLEREANIKPSAIYWQDIRYSNIYGPFTSLYETVNHYARVLDIMNSEQNQPDSKVVHVDFFNKKRIQFDK